MRLEESNVLAQNLLRERDGGQHSRSKRTLPSAPSIRNDAVSHAALIRLNCFGFMTFLQLSAEQTAHAAHVSLTIISSTFGTEPAALLYCLFSPPNRRTHSLSAVSCFPSISGPVCHSALAFSYFVFTSVSRSISSSLTTRAKPAHVGSQIFSHFCTVCHQLRLILSLRLKTDLQLASSRSSENLFVAALDPHK